MINTIEKARERVIDRFGEDAYVKIMYGLNSAIEKIHPLSEDEALDGDETLLIAKLFLAKLDEVNGND